MLLVSGGMTADQSIEWMDMEVDGKMRGPVHPVWATYCHLIKNAKIFLNGAISLVEAEELLRDGTGDLIVFGRPWLVNPDFASAAVAGKEKELLFEYNFDASDPGFLATKRELLLTRRFSILPSTQSEIKRRVISTIPSSRNQTTGLQS
jgi:hypothetical protein